MNICVSIQILDTSLLFPRNHYIHSLAGVWSSLLQYQADYTSTIIYTWQGGQSKLEKIWKNERKQPRFTLGFNALSALVLFFSHYKVFLLYYLLLCCITGQPSPFHSSHALSTLPWNVHLGLSISICLSTSDSTSDPASMCTYITTFYYSNILGRGAWSTPKIEEEKVGHERKNERKKERERGNCFHHLP